MYSLLLLNNRPRPYWILQIENCSSFDWSSALCTRVNMEKGQVHVTTYLDVRLFVCLFVRCLLLLQRKSFKSIIKILKGRPLFLEFAIATIKTFQQFHKPNFTIQIHKINCLLFYYCFNGTRHSISSPIIYRMCTVHNVHIETHKVSTFFFFFETVNLRCHQTSHISHTHARASVRTLHIIYQLILSILNKCEVFRSQQCRNKCSNLNRQTKHTTRTYKTNDENAIHTHTHTMHTCIHIYIL